MTIKERALALVASGSVGDGDTDAPTDRRRLVLEQEFAQVLKVLSREGPDRPPSVGR